MVEVRSETITVHRLSPSSGLVELNRDMWEPLPVVPTAGGPGPDAAGRTRRRLHAHW
jgi:hypothetical protein